jgi:glucokinase
MKLKIVKPLTLGVDLGGTKLKTMLIDAKGQILSVCKQPTNPCMGSEGVITDILTCINDCLKKVNQKAEALGIGIAGQVDFNGVVRDAPNLKWKNVHLKEKLEKKLGIPVIVVNDVQAVAYGEWNYGSGRGIDDIVVIFVGTGIGGGVISGGKMIIGCTNTGGELGHTTIIVGGRRCHCPNDGCLEAYAGGWAIAERAQEAVLNSPKAGAYLFSLAGNIDRITAATVGKAYQEGDSLAKNIVKETGQYLASGIVGIVNAFNPCLLILGGGVIEGIPRLIDIVEDGIRNKALKAAVENLKIVKAELGDNAGAIGAATLARKKIVTIPK